MIKKSILLLILLLAFCILSVSCGAENISTPSDDEIMAVAKYEVKKLIFSRFDPVFKDVQIVARDGQNRFIVTLTQDDTFDNYWAVWIEIDSSANSYHLYVGRHGEDFTKYGKLSQKEWIELFMSNPDFRWGQSIWDVSITTPMPSPSISPTPTPKPVIQSTPVPVVNVPSDDLVFRAAHKAVPFSENIYVDAIAERDGKNRFIVRINRGLAVTQYALLVEFDYSARFYSVFMEQYEPYSCDPNINELEKLFKSDVDFHWGEEPWCYEGEHSRSYGRKGLSQIESVEDLKTDLSYGQIIRVMAMKDGDISDLDDPDYQKRIIKEAGPTVSPSDRPSEETVLRAVKEAWGNYSTYESAEIIEKDNYNHYIVKIRRDTNQANDIFQYVAFDPGSDRFIAFDYRQLNFYIAALRWDRNPTPDEWIKIFKYDSVFHWETSAEDIPDTEYYKISGFDDYIYINRISSFSQAEQMEPAPEELILNESEEGFSDKVESSEHLDAYSEMNVSQNVNADSEDTETLSPEDTETYSSQGSQISFRAKTIKPTNIREAANKKSTLLRKLSGAGILVDVIESVVGDDGKIWYKLLLDNDMIGYARSDFFGEPIHEAETIYTDTYDKDQEDYYTSGSYPLTGKTNRDKVNVREEMDKNSTLLVTIPKKNTPVTILTDFVGSDNLIWYRVKYKEVYGFIRSDYIVLDASGANSGGANHELYGLANKKLATRSAPSPYAEDTGTYFVEGQRIRIYSRAYDPVEDAWWVKCDIPYHGEIRTLWAWYTRFDSKSLPLEQIPIEGSEYGQGITNAKVNVWTDPSTNSEIVKKLPVGELVTIVDILIGEDGNQWCKIDVNGYKFAYVLKEYIDMN